MGMESKNCFFRRTMGFSTLWAAWGTYEMLFHQVLRISPDSKEKGCPFSRR